MASRAGAVLLVEAVRRVGLDTALPSVAWLLLHAAMI